MPGDQEQLDDALNRLKSTSSQTKPEGETPAPDLPDPPACLLQQIRKGYFPRLLIPPQREVRLLTPSTWLWTHWLEDRSRNLPCSRKGCRYCDTLAAQEKGYLLAITPQPQIQLFTINRDEFVPISDLTLPGLKLRLDRRQRTSQLEIEKADRQQLAYRLPGFTQAQMDNFLCRLFGGISPVLLGKSRGDVGKRETVLEPDILQMPPRRQA